MTLPAAGTYLWGTPGGGLLPICLLLIDFFSYSASCCCCGLREAYYQFLKKPVMRAYSYFWLLLYN